MRQLKYGGTNSNYGYTFKADAVGFVSLNKRYRTKMSFQLQTVIDMSLFPIRDNIQRR